LEVNVKARLFACAVAGLACAFPVGAGAQVSGADAGRPYGAQPFASGPPAYAGGPRYALPSDQISANVRAAGLEPLSRPVLRGAVYYLRAVNRARTEMRVAIDARSGRVLSATRVAYEPPAPPAAGEPGLAQAQAPVPAPASAPAPRYEPYVSGRGYSEAAPVPPADVPVEGRPMPAGRAPNYGVTSPAKRLAAPLPRSRPGESGEVTASVPEAAPAKPESAPSAPNPLPAKPVMVPIAPLE
jgi:hypothetical protein